MTRMLKSLSIPLLSLVIAGCSLFGSDEETYYIPEPELYDLAIKALKDGRLADAIDRLETLETHYPFGRHSEQAQLELIYAYFKNGNNNEGLAAADRFLRLYPDHENIDYVYYMRGMINFEADKTLVDRFVPTDPSRRDPGAARDSFADFSTLLNRFPNSEYAPDAQKRMLFLKNQLAQYEIHVAHYYIKRGAWVAAANRGRYVVENYQQTPAVPYGLEVMVQAYHELGLHEAAANSQEVLVSNFPNFNSAAEESSSSWLSTLTFGWLGDDEEKTTPPEAGN